MPSGLWCTPIRKELQTHVWGWLGFTPALLSCGPGAQGPSREQAAARRAPAVGVSTLRFSSWRQAAAVKSWW